MDVCDFVDSEKIDVLAKLTADREDLVKTAEIPSRDEIDEKPFGDFAVVLNVGNGTYLRKYACYSKQLAELNALLLDETKATIPDEIVKTAAKMLKKACKRFRVEFPEELNKFAEACDNVTNVVLTDRINEYQWVKKQGAANMEKVASTESIYALPALGKYPLNSPELVKVAAAYFDKYFRKLSPENSHEFVQNTKLAAQKFNVDLSDCGEFTKRASLHDTEYNETYRASINYRKRLVDEEHVGVYDQLLSKHASLTPTNAAELLTKLDVSAGIDHLWNNRIDDPFVTTFGMAKVAESISVNGYDINEGHLQALESSGSVDEDTLKELQGDDGMNVFKSLPTPIKGKLAKEIHGAK